MDSQKGAVVDAGGQPITTVWRSELVMPPVAQVMYGMTRKSVASNGKGMEEGGDFVFHFLGGFWERYKPHICVTIIPTQFGPKIGALVTLT